MIRRNEFSRLRFRPKKGLRNAWKSDTTENFFKRRRQQTIEENKTDNYRSKLIQVRSQKVLQDPSRKLFNIERLNSSVKRIRNIRAQNSTFSWVSPLKAKDCVIGQSDCLFTSKQNAIMGDVKCRTQPQNNSLHTVDITETVGSFGNYLTSQCERKPSPRSVLNHKATLRRVFDQYSQLMKMSKKVDTLRPLVMTSSEFRKKRKPPTKPKYCSKTSGYASNDPVALAFYDSNEHFQSTFRKQPEIVSRVFESLSNNTFDIHSLILYNTLFVTKEASDEDRAAFVVGLLFNKSQQALTSDMYKQRLEQIVLTSKKLNYQKLQKLAASIYRITIEKNPNITREDLQKILVDNPDITEVVVSLLQLD